MLKFKKIYLLVLAFCLSTGVFAQKDKQAREVLDKTAAAMKNAGGIRAVFGGTSNGTLLLKGEQFYLNSGGVQSWFDGKTQWSYLESSGEVNISSPRNCKELILTPCCHFIKTVTTISIQELKNIMASKGMKSS
jgi:hypothetical protein